jgi:Fe-S cluster assembly protein SufD
VPGLEINTDDVRCSHGVTISNIDKNHMFYLQSRGINEEEAEALIINGFIHSSINRIKTDVFTNQISRLLGV